MARTKIILSAVILTVATITASAQQTDTLKSSTTGQKPVLEFFAGIDFNYRDIVLDKPYAFLINVTPGFKLHIWDHLQLDAGFIIPVVNQYGDDYARPRLNVFSLSHQMKFGKFALKPSIGLFTQERYGIDLKAMYTPTPWLALEVQGGYTGYCSMAHGWDMSPMSRYLALAGFDFYLRKWNTQFRVIGGRFLKDDNGVLVEGFRHFRHTSVGLYVQYSDFNSSSGRTLSDFNGGFKIVIAIPPYKRSGKHKVTFRPADNFRFTYNMNADPHSNKTYFTDSEQNERHGWFSPDILPWGANNIYDFQMK